MAEVKWSARRTSDGVLVDITGDTEGTPQTAPIPNALEAGGVGGAIAVDNTVDPPAEVTTLIAPGAVIVGDEATLNQQQMLAQTGGDSASVTVNATGAGAAEAVTEIVDGAAIGSLAVRAGSNQWSTTDAAGDSAGVSFGAGSIELTAAEDPTSHSLTIHGAEGLLLDSAPFNRAAFVANGSTVDQLRDALIASGLMEAS